MSNLDLDISGYDEATVFAALYNHALNFLGQPAPKAIGIATAGYIISLARRWEYCDGRTLALDLDRGVVNHVVYDAANGEGAAQRALNSIQVSR